jgi:spermidine/putrescine transport system ATP-binding protein
VNGSALDNQIEAKMVHEEFEGSFRHIVLEGTGAKEIKMSLINSGDSLGHNVGEVQTIGFDARMGVVLPRGPLASGE